MNRHTETVANCTHRGARSSCHGETSPVLLMRARGFSLVELSVVLVILALIGGVFTSMFMGLYDGQRATTTRNKLAAIDAALVSFAAVNKRLPCPADGAGVAGTEVIVSPDQPCVNQSRGVVPWVTLGLTATDIEDAWGTRITYRVDPYLARNNAMDMSNCDPAGTGIPSQPGAPPKPTCTVTGGVCAAATLNYCVSPASFLAAKGVEIRDAVGGTVLMNPAGAIPTGAAYALISHGENRSGGYGDGGQLLASVKSVEGINESQNRADGSQSYYVDAPQRFVDDASHFDDMVVRPSLMSVIQRAHLGPRSH
jgi:prepilin-type N-terminal cleavage/methylation domain-containing protein